MPSRMVNGRRSHLAVGEHRVAMAHEHDVAAGVAGRPVPRHSGPQAVAMPLLRDGFDRNSMLRQECANHVTDSVNSRLVVTATIDVHDLTEQRNHRVLLHPEPVDYGFAHASITFRVKMSLRGLKAESNLGE